MIKEQLAKAIREENFEEAARLRDLIMTLEGPSATQEAPHDK